MKFGLNPFLLTQFVSTLFLARKIFAFKPRRFCILPIGIFPPIIASKAPLEWYSSSESWSNMGECCCALMIAEVNINYKLKVALKIIIVFETISCWQILCHTHVSECLQTHVQKPPFSEEKAQIVFLGHHLSREAWKILCPWQIIPAYLRGNRSHPLYSELASACSN